MKAIIVIECDEDNEVIQHLTVVRKQLKAAILKRRKTPDDLTDIVVDDDNCYGSHMATIEFDGSDTSHIVLANYTN
jgi:hypothetical protein